MILMKDVTKIFNIKDKRIVAVDHLNLDIRKGETFGLIGPTGSGKTTTIKMCSTLILPDEGSILIDGHDVIKEEEIIKKKIGVLAGEFVRLLYWRLTGRQNLELFAKLRNMWEYEERVERLLELFGLKDRENDLVMHYSTGMKHKLAFAIALLSDPPILFLDEPLTGIDPLTSYGIKKLVKEEFNEKTIIWTSHNLYEIEEMCDRIGLLNRGKLVLEGSPKDLREKYREYAKVRIVSTNTKPFLEIKGAEMGKEGVEIKTTDVTATIQDIIEVCKRNNIKIDDIKTVKPSLEEIFMESVKNA